MTEMGSLITRWSPKHYKSTLINDHRDTFPSKCVTVVKDIIARRRLDANRETVILSVLSIKTPFLSTKAHIISLVLSEKIGQLKLQSSDGKYYKTDIADQEQLFRLIHKVYSKRFPKLVNLNFITDRITLYLLKV